MENITPILFPIFSALLGSFATYYWQQKQKKDEAISRYKEERYTQLLTSISGFFIGSDSTDLKKKFLDERTKAWLYCSDDVSKAMNRFLELSSQGCSDYDTSSKAIGEIVIAIRRDIGHNTKLISTDFKMYNPSSSDK